MRGLSAYTRILNDMTTIVTGLWKIYQLLKSGKQHSGCYEASDAWHWSEIKCSSLCLRLPANQLFYKQHAKAKIILKYKSPTLLAFYKVIPLITFGFTLDGASNKEMTLWRFYRQA